MKYLILVALILASCGKTATENVMPHTVPTATPAATTTYSVPVYPAYPVCPVNTCGGVR